MVAGLLSKSFFISAFALKSSTGWHGSFPNRSDPCDLVVQQVHFS